MKRCDLCGSECRPYDTQILRELYQVDGVQEICSSCAQWANQLHTKLHREIDRKMRAAISERISLQPPAPLWQRLRRTWSVRFTAFGR